MTHYARAHLAIAEAPSKMNPPDTNRKCHQKHSYTVTPGSTATNTKNGKKYHQPCF